MSDELNNALAEQLVNENRRLSTENQELLQLNEAHNVLATRVQELGGIEAIMEALNAGRRNEQEEEILESFTRNIEQYGSLEVIQESLEQYSSFTEKHGPLSKVEEALMGSKCHLESLAAFVRENGSLEEVSEALKKVEDRLPRINEGLAMAKASREFQEKFGTFDQIEEALTRSVAVLGVQAKKVKAAKIQSICESLGMTVEKASELMVKHHVDLDGLKDLCESFGTPKSEGGDINESRQAQTQVQKDPVKKVARGKLFLDMVKEKPVQGEVEVNESKQGEKKDPFRAKTRLERMIG